MIDATASPPSRSSPHELGDDASTSLPAETTRCLTTTPVDPTSIGETRDVSHTAEVAEPATSPDQAEAARLAAVRRYGILDTPPDGAFDHVADLAAEILQVPYATVSIVDVDRIWFKAAHGLTGVTQIGRDPGLCASAILKDELYLVSDASLDPRALTNPLVRGELRIRFYAGAPIITPDGYRLGTVNVFDTVPRHFPAHSLAILPHLASIVADQLEVRLAALTTIRAERELRRQAEKDTATIDEFATILQRTLLPPTLPSVPGLELACHYHTASARDVGGDFYDVFALDHGRWGFFIGDVEGHGAQAAALTSLTRYTLRAAAWRDPDPVAVLSELNDAVLMDRNSHLCCTVVYGVLAPEASGGFRIVLGSGGHPPAVWLRPARSGAAGRADVVWPEGGQLLGALSEPVIATREVLLRPGQTLLLYTDGLTDRRPGGEALGEEGLVEFLGSHTGRPANSLIAEIVQLIAGFDPAPNDDVALLAFTARRR